jgi:tetratricopeptide (TPR) repeat protein
MSRQELADAVNRYLADKQDPDGPVTANHVGKLEQGLYTWPRALRRQAYRAVLGAASDAQLGFFNIRRRPSAAEMIPAPGARPASPARPPNQLPSQPEHPSAVGGGPAAVCGSIMTGSPQWSLPVRSAAHLEELLAHLRDQWHALVKTDNLLGPRFALTGVLNQLLVVEALLTQVRVQHRDAVLRLAAGYAESAAWLYEDSGDLARSGQWTDRAMAWAYEADDHVMVAWAMFRRSQQAADGGRGDEVVGLARAARRREHRLPEPMRAAIRVQEAYGHAVNGEPAATHELLDQAHAWAAQDTAGDARTGQGSYCTSGYIELQRASCLLALKQPGPAVQLFQRALPTLPVVYQRDRAAALSRMAAAFAAVGHPEQAAATAASALSTARTAGSRRVEAQIRHVAHILARHRHLAPVDELLHDLQRPES